MAIPERVSSLTYAVRFRAIAKYFGQLCLGVAVATIVPLAAALFLGEYEVGLRLAAVAGALTLSGILLAAQRAPVQRQTNEALLITALIFLLVSLVMAYPLSAPGVPFIDALFESVSAVTTTGLTTLGTLSDKQDIFLFTRAWMQWYGGLGIVVLSLALLMQPGTAARRLGHTALEWDNLIASTRLHARRVIQVYLVLTIAGVSALWLAGDTLYSALLHALAGISTGGLSIHEDSLAGLGGWTAQAVLMLLAFTGAVSLILYHPVYFRNRHEYAGYMELKGLLAAAIAAAFLLALCLWATGEMP